MLSGLLCRKASRYLPGYICEGFEKVKLKILCIDMQLFSKLIFDEKHCIYWQMWGVKLPVCLPFAGAVGVPVTLIFVT